MNILAVDTSTSLCSVALMHDGRMEVLGEQVSGKHSRVLFAQITEILKSADVAISSLDAVLYAAGPGSYTGLRVGGSALKGLLFPYSGVEFFAASTLAAYACCVLPDEIQRRSSDSAAEELDSTSTHTLQNFIEPVQEQHPTQNARFSDQENAHGSSIPLQIHAIIDARRQHAYHQSFNISHDGIIAHTTAQILPLATIESMLEEGDYIIGTGLHRLDAKKTVHVHKFAEDTIDAAGLLRLYSLDINREFIKPADIRTFEPDYMSGSTWNHAR